MKRLLSILLIGVVTVGVYLGFFNNTHSGFVKPCSTYLIISHKDTQLNLLIDFLSSQDNGMGILTVSGTYFENDKKIGVIRRLVKYDWVLLNSSYRLSTTEIRKSNRDETLSDEDLELLLPGFFTHIGGKFDLTIATVDNAGYVFSAGVRPLFFCEVTN
ncbi:hypothetical protein [Citrobacter amalonaticus]|jgi:hypothetical protein|uniref:Uncharacterized protein n=1 Tax=Citrobacter amalonaticus TaxID=35703 RepID=A0A8I0MKZ3_CITAM|nr:hypothetical protein [Citrobacter amalonaticus]MBE0128912.1 hypothetical protein [Citrobacter amalonaticus]MCO4157697.1 hypothetical protein [Citrobacter amalonaticus]MCR9030933.1 hypothetical protein [Citrobacter amalonaticus]